MLVSAPTSGSCSIGGSVRRPGGRGRDVHHAVRAVEVLVDVLDQVRDPDLWEYVVRRVGVGLPGALGRLEQRHDRVGTGRR